MDWVMSGAVSALWAMFGHWQVLVGLVVLIALGVLYLLYKPAADLMIKIAGWVLDFARTPLGKITIIATAVAFGLWWGCMAIYQLGYDARDKLAQEEAAAVKAAAEKALKERREAIAAIVLANVDAAKTVDERLRQRDADRQAKTITITKEVTKYVPATADARCVVPAGFVWLHNASRVGLPATAAPSGPAIEADSGVALSDLAKDDARTVELYNACRDQVAETVAWYEGVRTRYSQMRGAE